MPLEKYRPDNMTVDLSETQFQQIEHLLKQPMTDVFVRDASFYCARISDLDRRLNNDQAMRMRAAASMVSLTLDELLGLNKDLNERFVKAVFNPQENNNIVMAALVGDIESVTRLMQMSQGGFWGRIFSNSQPINLNGDFFPACIASGNHDLINYVAQFFLVISDIGGFNFDTSSEKIASDEALARGRDLVITNLAKVGSQDLIDSFINKSGMNNVHKVSQQERERYYLCLKVGFLRKAQTQDEWFEFSRFASKCLSVDENHHLLFEGVSLPYHGVDLRSSYQVAKLNSPLSSAVPSIWGSRREVSLAFLSHPIVGMVTYRSIKNLSKDKKSQLEKLPLALIRNIESWVAVNPVPVELRQLDFGLSNLVWDFIPQKISLANITYWQFMGLARNAIRFGSVDQFIQVITKFEEFQNGLEDRLKLSLPKVDVLLKLCVLYRRHDLIDVIQGLSKYKACIALVPKADDVEEFNILRRAIIKRGKITTRGALLRTIFNSQHVNAYFNMRDNLGVRLSL